MASNLNKAFMRAYAKERSAAQSEPKPVQPAAVPTSPVSEVVPSQESVRGNSFAAEFDPAPAVTTTSRGASQVWQRIDRAHEQPKPHLGSQSARPATVAAAVGQARSPRSLQVAAKPAANHLVPGSTSHSSPAHPWIAESAEGYGLAAAAPEAMADGAKVEARRRTVADFLYAAGQVTTSAKAASIDLSASHSVTGHSVTGHQPRSLPLGSFTPTHPTAVVADSRNPRPTSPQVSAGYWRGAMASNYFQHRQVPVVNQSAATTEIPSFQSSKSMAEPASRFQPRGVQRSREESTGYQAAESSLSQVDTAAPPVAGSNRESTQVDLGSRSAGQILRVDVPRARQRPEPEPTQPAVAASECDVEAPLAPQVETVDVEAAAAVQLADQRGRLDREQAIHIAEKNLRRAAHQIFNPVWEVDSLQWSSVCDKLMLERAESMTQVAEHLKAACQEGLNVLAVTSAQRGEGRTTVACCLARLAAAHGLKVALVDVDLETTTLCLQTNLEVEHDWCDWLSGRASLEEVAVHSLEDQLTVFPLKPGEDLVEVAERQSQIVDMLAQLADSFELVIVDTSCLNSGGNVVRGLAEAGIVDAAIIVADRRKTSPQRIEKAVSAVQIAGIESIGIVENFST